MNAPAKRGSIEKTTPIDSNVEFEQEDHAVIERADLLRIAFVIVVASIVWFTPQLSWLGIGGVLGGGFPIFAEAFKNLRERRMTMELSMTLALLAALVIREFFTALIITLFVLVAEILEGLTVSRGRQAIADLLQYMPSTAVVWLSGEFVECPIGAVSTGRPRADTTGFSNPGRWQGGGRKLECRRGSDYRRTSSTREDTRQFGLRRNDESDGSP